MTMSKIYKVIFNNNEVLVESRKLNKQTIVQKKKITNKNKSEMHIVANDVLDCMNKAKEQYFAKFNEYAKSVEVRKSTSKELFDSHFAEMFDSMKTFKQKEELYNHLHKLANNEISSQKVSA